MALVFPVIVKRDGALGQDRASLVRARIDSSPRGVKCNVPRNQGWAWRKGWFY